MVTPPIIDIDAFLQNVSEEEPSGPAAREHPDLSRSFYAIREARNAATNSEKMIAKFALMTDEEIQQELAGRSDDPRRPPDWGKVFDLSQQLLSSQSKDLWVVSWLIEAAIRLEGIVGLRDGLNLCASIVEKFWSTIHPRPEDDEDGARYTVSQLDGLNATVPAILEASPILPNDSRFTWRSYRAALSIENDPPEVRALKIEAGAITLQMFTTAMHQVGAETLMTIKEDIEAALESVSHFDNIMQTTCGYDRDGSIAPSMTNIAELLSKIKNDFAEMSAFVLDQDNATDSEVTVAEQSGVMSTGQAIASKPVMSREDAFQHLLKVADYFRKTEPHSPVSYALEQAVRWGRMPLPDLLLDLVGDNETLQSMYRRMGIIPTKNDDY